jgi:excisionase family DNA binding protein
MEESTRYLSPRDAARRLGVRLDGVYSLIWAGRIKARKREGRWQIDVESVEARLNQRSRELGTCRER